MPQDVGNYEITAMQQAIVSRITAFSYFQNINVFYERLKNLDAEIEKALGTLSDTYSRGICILVLTPTGNDERENSPAASFDPFRVTVSVMEDPLFNMEDGGSMIPAADMGLTAYRCLKGFQPAFANAPLTPDSPTYSIAPSDDLVVYEIRLKTKLVLPPLRLEGEGAFVKGEA